MAVYKIVNADNYDSDYPDERFVEGLPVMNEDQANVICDAINLTLSTHEPRYFKVVSNDYTLSPGFEP